MSLFDDIKAKADANGDGKISLDDLESFKGGDNDNIIDELKEKFLGSDGKISIDDLANLNLDTIKKNAGDVVDNVKSSLGGLFDRK